MLLRKEVARISSMHKHQVEFSAEGQLVIRLLHFSLATQHAARGEMEKALQHFGYSCSQATCPFGERPLSPALLAYYQSARAARRGGGGASAQLQWCRSEEGEGRE